MQLMAVALSSEGLEPAQCEGFVPRDFAPGESLTGAKDARF